MQFIKAHWKQILTLLASLAVAVLLNLGKLSADQATAIGMGLALVGIHLAPITYGAAKKVAGPLVLILGLGAVCSTQTACNATSAQLQTTESDGMKLAGCVLGQIFAGNTDPGSISGQCAGALPSLIVDIINDFEAKPDAGMGVASASDERALLNTAKQKALAAEAK